MAATYLFLNYNWISVSETSFANRWEYSRIYSAYYLLFKSVTIENLRINSDCPATDESN